MSWCNLGWMSCWWMDRAIIRSGELRRTSLSSSSSVSDVRHRLAAAAAMTAPSELDELESSLSLARLVFPPAMVRSTVRRVFCLAADDTMPYNAWTQFPSELIPKNYSNKFELTSFTFAMSSRTSDINVRSMAAQCNKERRASS